MAIREANLADAPGIAKVHIDTWRTTYSKLMPAKFLADLSYEERETKWVKILSNITQDDFTYITEDETGQIVGFASGGKERTGDCLYQGELYAIYILEKYQRQGLGYRLVSTIATRLMQSGISSMLVWVLADNPAAHFYQSLGGQQVNQKQIEIATVQLVEVAYGWIDTRKGII
ncbi:GNAT family N-acetyltransferase [Nostoc sp. 'Peltigera membranacea cyanobiont' 213]|uniref:GNAT family N-acetyltransferase n=1 Tax=Nostoc sp. 'Peltigera membranacea cyanobiont' 213 TaxID=2014530 RepID=UPI000B951CE9|nr:GNAT family N-acetyltransferase [Nostoc sp. 'Peltigera membranacea cyanobiont' 213]OYD98836.1 GNAT family N-acetyltransferase [Nostoc sp. 'Peltigera membranacea cyanobiont' 213]